MDVGEDVAQLIDVPGAYSLRPTCKAEEIAARMLEEDEPDVIVNVVDATNLERNLYLTLQILEKKVPTVLVLNLWDAAKNEGIEINAKALEKELGIPVVPVVALSGEGISELVEEIEKAAKNGKPKPRKLPKTDKERWALIGEIVQKVQKVEHRHPTFLEKLSEASVRPTTGAPIALGVILLSFIAIIFVGNFFTEQIFDPLFTNYYGPVITSAVESVAPVGVVHDLLVGAAPEFLESFGLLTTGIYVPIAIVLPFVFLFYLILGFLEDFGYLPRMAVLADTIMHRLGLHGAAVIPATLALGCNVPGCLACRILETKRERFIAMTLMAISVPCIAQTAVILGLLAPFGLKWIMLVYGTLFVVYVGLGVILNKIASGRSPEIFLEIPPYRLPCARSVLKKTWTRMKWFIREAIPFVLLGVFIVNVLYMLGVMTFLANGLSPVLTKWLGLPKEAISALLLGFLRKDIATGLLAPLNLTAAQLSVACVTLAMYFPCVATFVVMLKELGAKDMFKAMGLMIVVALAVGGMLNFMLSILL
jgi:ferrous iron transport protein B